MPPPYEARFTERLMGKVLAMPTEPAVPTLFEVMKRAVDVCDPEAAYPETGALLLRFEDRDEPITSLADPDGEIHELAALDHAVAGPAEVMAVAVAVYLAFRRTELDGDRQEVLRLAARAEFDGNPPEPIREWLVSEGVAL